MSGFGITPRKATDRGGYACMMRKRNVAVGSKDWVLVNCPKCGEECWRTPLTEIAEQTGAVAVCTACALSAGQNPSQNTK